MNFFNPAKWSLSRKFVSIVLLILLIPLASIGLLKEIEKTLKANLEHNLLLSSRLIGNQLSANQSWFAESLLPESDNILAKELFVFPLSASYELDGYTDEWADYEPHRKTFTKNETSLDILLGSFERHLIASIDVQDPSVVYPSADSSIVADQVEVEFKTQKGDYQKIILSTRSAGNFPVKTKKNGKLQIDWRFKAAWIVTEQGFHIELQFPSGFKPQQIRIVHNNVDHQGKYRFENTYATSRYDLNPLVWPSVNLVNYFNAIELSPAQRIWLLDTQKRVLISKGDLRTEEISFSTNPFLHWILASQSEIEIDPRKNNLHLDSQEVYRALKGGSSTRIENIRGSDQSIALAALPIKVEDKVLGVLLLEENVARVQIPQKKALINMFAVIFAVFLLVMWIIFWYVSRMVGRIKHLNNEIEQVVDQSGRMKAPLSLDVEKGDEIDDLYRAFSHMGSKLYEYNDHLEKLASRLSHELRTPIAIVRSSLDNLLLNSQDDEDKEIINRALEGNQRLGEIITRMRQASGVKEAMQTAEKELINLDDFLTQIVKGYQLSFKQHEFVLDSSLIQKQQTISPDLFAEMLDKLISNAMEFSEAKQPIRIDLSQDKNSTTLSVKNSGSTIPKKNLKRIFQSLVSIRTNQQSTGTNLGLGLYVVRLIAEFHGSTVKAENLKDGSGVVFVVRW